MDCGAAVTPVVVESPFRGETGSPEEYERNRRYLERCLSDCLSRGESPYASHKMLTVCLDDTVPEERAKGIAAGLVWRRLVPLRAFYLDYGMSPGMMRVRELYDEEGLAYVDRRIGREP